MNGRPNESWSLGQSKAWLRERVDAGERCPCCDQYAKVYRRALPAPAAALLCSLARCSAPGEYVYLPDHIAEQHDSKTAQQGGYLTLSHWWNLIEQRDGPREDGAKQNGWWKLTTLGRRFVSTSATVRRYALLYDGRCLGLDGELITIHDALGERFDYGALMGQRPNVGEAPPESDQRSLL